MIAFLSIVWTTILFAGPFVNYWNDIVYAWFVLIMAAPIYVVNIIASLLYVYIYRCMLSSAKRILIMVSILAIQILSHIPYVRLDMIYLDLIPFGTMFKDASDNTIYY